jgi:hypothetical protein
VRFGDRQRTFANSPTRGAPGRRAAEARHAGRRRVAMLSLNSDRYLEYQMAVPWGGGVLNPCNIRWSAARDPVLAGRLGLHLCSSTRPSARWSSSSAATREPCAR